MSVRPPAFAGDAETVKVEFSPAGAVRCVSKEAPLSKVIGPIRPRSELVPLLQRSPANVGKTTKD